MQYRKYSRFRLSTYIFIFYITKKSKLFNEALRSVKHPNNLQSEYYINWAYFFMKKEIW